VSFMGLLMIFASAGESLVFDLAIDRDQRRCITFEASTFFPVMRKISRSIASKS
jgi:hypothetical protein